MELVTNIDNINEELILIKTIFREHLNSALLPDVVTVNVEPKDQIIRITISTEKEVVLQRDFDYIITKGESILKYEKKFAKIALYQYLTLLTSYKAPWGALTGIRPTKLYYELLKQNKTKRQIYDIFKNKYFVSKSKIKQLELIIKEQSQIKYCYDSIDLYINIPFCTSKCYYCSFISLPLDKCSDLVQPYVKSLIYEINQTLKYLTDNNIKVNTIYIGGGTPTAIGVENLRQILDLLPKTVKELTVEAGRPDTINKEMLDMLASYNVTRISINPQTFCDNTLKLIGRNHLAKDVYDVYEMARQYSFEINMDLIAGLGNETFKIFKQSLLKTIKLKPDNITIHTLSIKRASNLKDIGGEYAQTKEVEKMIKYSNKKLLKKGYNPYYLYRQKNMLGNLENIGYCKKGTICEFNVNSMEETLSVIACGANAISKCIDYSINKISRHANVKNIQEYINRIDEMVEKKLDLFDTNSNILIK